MPKITLAGGKTETRSSKRKFKMGGGELCGYHKPAGGTCQLAAGWGTDHKGFGKCKWHGGNSPSHIKAALKAEAVQLMGAPLEINPLDALLWCIRITAGEVQWLGDRMGELEEKEWIENTLMGKQFHLYSRQRQTLVAQLARYSKMAIDVGLAERSVRLAEQYGNMLARLISGILGDLELTSLQQERAPLVVRKHLIAVQDGSVTAGSMLQSVNGGANREGIVTRGPLPPTVEVAATRKEAE